MNSQELKCFVVAADRLNFTRAAKELYVTPPTVTHHIQHLEEELGVKLFIRITLMSFPIAKNIFL